MTHARRELGERIKEVRGQLNLNQEDFAKLMQASTNTVARWERGEVEPKGAHKNKVENILELRNSPEMMARLNNALKSEGGIIAGAAFLGAMFGILGIAGVGLAALAPGLITGKLPFVTSLIECFTSKEAKEAEDHEK